MIFRKLFKRRRSGTIARERLQILLVTDRIGCNPNTTESIKNDIINTISKYIDIDVENCIVESRDTIRANTRYVGENGVRIVVEKNERYAL